MFHHDCADEECTISEWYIYGTRKCIFLYYHACWGRRKHRELNRDATVRDTVIVFNEMWSHIARSFQKHSFAVRLFTSETWHFILLRLFVCFLLFRQNRSWVAFHFIVLLSKHIYRISSMQYNTYMKDVETSIGFFFFFF